MLVKDELNWTLLSCFMCPIWISENTTAVSLDGDFVTCSLGPLDDGTRIDIDSCSEDAIEFMLGEIMFGDFCRILLVSYSSVLIMDCFGIPICNMS